MTAKTRQQLLILLALIVIGVIAVVAMRPAGPTAETITGPSNRSGRGGAAAGRTVPVVDVKLELLDRAHDEVSGPERNPFRFQPKAPPPSAITRPAPRPAAAIRKSPEMNSKTLVMTTLVRTTKTCPKTSD